MTDIRTQIAQLDIDESTKKLLLEKVGTETDPKKVAEIVTSVLDAAEEVLIQKGASLDKELAAANAEYEKEQDAAEQQFDSAMTRLEKEAADIYVSTSRDMDALYADDLRTSLQK